MIGRSGERWSRISVLAARHDNDDDDICLKRIISYLKPHEGMRIIHTRLEYLKPYNCV